MRLTTLAACVWLACGAAWAEDCSAGREQALALGYDDFDSDRTVGWRAVADKQGCFAAAADLLEAYRRAHAEDVSEQDQRSLRWHEGQMRAADEQRDAAIALFESTRRGDPSVHIRADDLYLDATLAFLRQDRAALERARAELASLPEPEGFHAAVERARERYGDAFADSITWPSNLGVVDGFLNCFDRPYAEAYGGACRGLAAQ